MCESFQTENMREKESFILIEKLSQRSVFPPQKKKKNKKEYMNIELEFFCPLWRWLGFSSSSGSWWRCWRLSPSGASGRWLGCK